MELSIPNKIFFDHNIAPFTKLLYGFLNTRPSNNFLFDNLAHELGISEYKLQNHLYSLKNNGLIHFRRYQGEITIIFNDLGE